ncbi:hypothetical protein RD792_010954 [Penstemon davidsonii]|uniref:dihydrolipoyllysine-residue succinyltransferase n=1 Tax=Penstemon davidsonii TaxID=160366 RepID=A0ABR0D3G3_9LAMI|nr:hypothetical protein RD792_010954 [Penstemon davidsonii]
MLGILRRKAASGASSASVYGKSIYKLKPAVSTPRACSAFHEEIIHHPRGVGHVRNFCHLPLAGHMKSSMPKREIVGNLQQDVMQIWSRSFCSNNEGDLVEAVVPYMGESISDGTLSTFLKKPGDRVQIDEPIAQVETDKSMDTGPVESWEFWLPGLGLQEARVTIDVNSPESGVIQKFLANEGDTVEPGTKVAIISKSSEGVAHVAPSDEKPSEKAAAPPSPPAEEKKEKPTPKVETTPVAEKPKRTPPPPPRSSATEPQLPPKERERRVPMTRLRKRVATRLKDSQNTFALLTTFNEVDMTNLMKLRSDYKDAFVEKHGVKLGLMSGFVKAAISALQKQPIVNAVIDGDDIIYRDYVDISIAGLVVPVLRNAESMNFAEVEKEINTLAQKALNGTISIDEMAGGTFTISNGGVYGSLLSTPIINPPQSAILGMHSIVNRPMVVGGNIVSRPMMYIALTYDHRLIDGREAVFFLRRIKDVVEDPRRLLLDRQEIKGVMLGVLRRKAASGASSASVYGKSVYKPKPAVSTPRACSAFQEEIIHHPRVVGHVRNFCNLPLAGHMKSSMPKRMLVGFTILKVGAACLRRNMNTCSVANQPSSSAKTDVKGDLVEAVVPYMGESISDGTLSAFLKKPGDRVEIDEPIAQVETDKTPEAGNLGLLAAEYRHWMTGDFGWLDWDFRKLGWLLVFLSSQVTIDVNSPESGVIQKFLANEGDTVEPGTKVAIISKSSEGVAHVAPSDEKPSEKAAAPPSPPAEEKKEKPTPKVETTPVVEKPKRSPPPPPRSSATEPQLPPKERERRVPMTRLRKRVATRLKDSQNTFALLTTFNEVDMTNLMKLRSDYKDAFVEKHGVKLGLMSGFVKAAISALQKQPIVNAVIDGDDIIYRDYVDISIAGLVVPVLRNAESMNFAEVEKEINTLAQKALNGTISIDEMAGGTFTISNGGVYGSLLSTPVINPPQSAILGMHSIVNRPMFVGGNIVSRPMMHIALTYDHRLIDGREAVFFLRRIKDVVEDPRRLLLDV